MKVLAIVGSPRKGGNTDILVDRVLDGARDRGAEVEKIYLKDLKINFCRGCETCVNVKPWRGCAQKDDMSQVYDALGRCDALVIGTPIYFFGPSAQTKVFLDRWMAVINSDDGGARHSLKGKRLVVAMAYGDIEPFAAGATNAWGTFRDAAHYMKMNLVGWVHGSAGDKGEMASRTEILARAFELGRELCEGE